MLDGQTRASASFYGEFPPLQDWDTPQGHNTRRFLYHTNPAEYERQRHLEEPNNHIVIIDLKCKKEYRIINIYRSFSPNNNITPTERFKNQLKIIKNAMNANPNKKTIILGDFNLDRLKLIGLGSPQPAYSLTEEKVRFAYETQVFYSMMDSLELCQFVFGPTWTLYGPAETVEMIRAVTGWDVTVDEMMEVGRRRLDLLRTFNAREGFGRKDDKLPKKFFKALTGTGPTAGFALTHAEVDSAIDHYYKLAGWTSDGVPTRATLKKHDIEWAAEYLPA